MQGIDTQIMSAWLDAMDGTAFDCIDIEVNTITVEFFDGTQTDQLSLDVDRVRAIMTHKLTEAVHTGIKHTEMVRDHA